MFYNIFTFAIVVGVLVLYDVEAANADERMAQQHLLHAEKLCGREFEEHLTALGEQIADHVKSSQKSMDSMQDTPGATPAMYNSMLTHWLWGQTQAAKIEVDGAMVALHCTTLRSLGVLK